MNAELGNRPSRNGLATSGSERSCARLTLLSFAFSRKSRGVIRMVSKKQHDATAVLRAWRGGEALETVST